MLALLVLIGGTPLSAQRSDRRVIDAATIAAYGWHRVGEIVAALAPGSTASLDGFNHEITGSRLGFRAVSGARPMWVVRLDGQVMPVSVGGLWILDAIPVAIPQLDSVVITEGPRIVDGQSAMLGTIDLHTRRPPRGPSLIADYQHGDESGDPGPYRYTSRATANVEKLGPFTSGALSYATASAAIDVAARYASLNITDERILTRLGSAFQFLQSDVNASGGSGVATIDAAGGRHFVIAGRGRFTGLLLPPAIATYQSARIVTSHAGVSGAFTRARRGWRYAATATELEGQPLGEAFPMLIDRRRRSGDVFVETGLVGPLRVGIGGNATRIEDSAGGTSEAQSGRAWLSYAGAPGTATIAADGAAGGIRLSAMARHERGVGASDRLAFTVSALTSPDDASAVVDARAEITTRDLLGLRPTWYARGFTYGLRSPGGRANGVAVGLTAATDVSRRIRTWVRAEATQMIGDARLGESSTPGGFAEGLVSVKTQGRFSIALSGRFAPATRWALSDAETDLDVPGTNRVDLSVNKTLWKERVRAQLVMRNLFDAEERTHPDGAQWNLRTHLAVTIALPSSESARR